MNYPQKPGFNLYQIAALCLYNIQRENLFKKKISLYMSSIYLEGHNNNLIFKNG